MGAYRLLLHLYPASFRNEYGEEMRASLWIATIGEVTANAACVHWDIFTQDLRYIGRTLRRAPGFAIAAVLIVALGIGATTAAFSVTDFVLLRPLPFPDAHRLVIDLSDKDRVSPAAPLHARACQPNSRLPTRYKELR